MTSRQPRQSLRNRRRSVPAALVTTALTLAAIIAVAFTVHLGPSGTGSVSPRAAADTVNPTCAALRAQFGPGWPCISVPNYTPTTSLPTAPTAPTGNDNSGNANMGVDAGPGPGQGNGTPIVPVPGQAPPEIAPQAAPTIPATSPLVTPPASNPPARSAPSADQYGLSSPADWIAQIFTGFRHDADSVSGDPNDPANNACEHCSKDAQGDIQNGEVDTPKHAQAQLGALSACPDGYHKRYYDLGAMAECTRDKVYTVTNATTGAEVKDPYNQPVFTCTSATSGQSLNVGVTTQTITAVSNSTSSSSGITLGASGAGANAVTESGTSVTVSRSSTFSQGQTVVCPQLSPGQTARYYMMYRPTTYTIRIEDTKSGDVSYRPAISLVPVFPLDEEVS